MIAGWEQGRQHIGLAPPQPKATDEPAELNLPMLLITSSDDQVVLNDGTRQLAALFGGAKLRIFEGTGPV